jgi:hypothetical protein
MDEHSLPFEIDREVLDHAVERAQKMLDSATSEAAAETEVGLLVNEAGGFYMIPSPPQADLLLFTSRAFAEDYRSCFPDMQRATVGGVRLGQVAGVVRKNMSRIGGVVFNKCPRCPIGVRLSVPAAGDAWQLFGSRATTIATRELLVERDLARALAEPDPSRQREILVNIRDHHDPGVPRVHFAIGLNAIKSGDPALYVRALAALVPFGDVWTMPLREKGKEVFRAE